MNALGRGIAVSALVAVSLLAGSARQGGTAQPEGVPTCRGEAATMVGTAGDDLLVGTEEHDVVVGGPGDDEIHGRRASDLLCGGDGADLLLGGRGNDTLLAGPGDRDWAFGGMGDDTALGGPGDFDEVAGGLGIDTVSGGPGDFDLVHGDYGWDHMDGGPGRGDVASFATSVAGGRGAGVWVSLKAGMARGDGRDDLARFEAIEGSAFGDMLIGDGRASSIDGGPGDDVLVGGGGRDRLHGGQGSDRCRGGAAGGSVSCGREPPPKGSAYVELDRAVGGGGGLAIVGAGGPDEMVLALDGETSTFEVTAAKGFAIGPGCSRPDGDPRRALCSAGGPARWVMADMGPGDDTLTVAGSLAAAQNVRLAGGLGDDEIRGGPEDDLIEAGPGRDRLYGGAGEDSLVGGLPGPTILHGGPDPDLIAAGGGCAGGALIGGEGRDNGSFAETAGHPGLLFVSLRHDRAWVDGVRGCRPVRLDVEDIEGSFGKDVMIGDGRDNYMLGQPGRDRFFGGGGDDVIDARDETPDFRIQCSRPGRSEGRALVDAVDPAAVACAMSRIGEPIHDLN